MLERISPNIQTKTKILFSRVLKSEAITKVHYAKKVAYISTNLHMVWKKDSNSIIIYAFLNVTKVI